MIDFIKIQYTEKSRFENFIMSSENYENVQGRYNIRTGEEEFPYKTKLDDVLELKICKKTAFVQNSLHKLYNKINEGIDHNHNDFTYSKLIKTLDYVSDKIIDSTCTKITNLEFGLNVQIFEKAEVLVEKKVFNFQDQNYNANRDFKGKGKLKQFTKSDYLIKIYDKAKQYDLDQNLLRFELKLTRARSINKHKIYCLDDLRDEEKLQSLFKEYISRFDQLIILDPYQDEIFETKQEAMKMLRYMNPNYWEHIINESSRTTKARNKKEFLSLINKYNLNTTQIRVRNSLVEKFDFLISN